MQLLVPTSEGVLEIPINQFHRGLGDEDHHEE